MLILSKGEANRSKRKTVLNECSSRSHTLVELSFIGLEGSPKITLVDLAGSERFTDDQLRNKTHQTESKNINQSLTHLGR
jgi:Kinesin motor domain